MSKRLLLVMVAFILAAGGFACGGGGGVDGTNAANQLEQIKKAKSEGKKLDAKQRELLEESKIDAESADTTTTASK